MVQFVLDTDHLTLFEQGHAKVANRVAAMQAGTIALPIVAVEEALRGRLGSLANAKTSAERIKRYQRLANTLQLILRFGIVAYDQPAETTLDALRALRLKIGTQDLKIAAIALSLDCTVVTRNKRDFSAVPSLKIEDWST